MVRLMIAMFVILVHGGAQAEGFYVDSVCEAVKLDVRIDSISIFDARFCCDLDRGDNPFQGSRAVAYERISGADQIDQQEVCAYAANAEFPPGYNLSLMARDGGQRGIPGGNMAAYFVPETNQTIEYSCPPGQLVSILYECPCGVVHTESGTLACNPKQALDGVIEVTPDLLLIQPENALPRPSNDLPRPVDPLIRQQ